MCEEGMRHGGEGGKISSDGRSVGRTDAEISLTRGADGRIFSRQSDGGGMADADRQRGLHGVGVNCPIWRECN